MDGVPFNIPPAASKMASANNLSKEGHKLGEIEKKVREELSKYNEDEQMNVLVVGKAGAGKSSFINTMHMAIAHDWHEVANYGRTHRGRGITTDLIRYEMFRDELTNPPIENYHHNVFFWDTAGMENFRDDSCEAFLGLIMDGRVPSDTNIHHQIGTGDSRHVMMRSLEKRFPRPAAGEETCKFHRVVFICAADEELPLNLMASVLNAAAKDQTHARSLPIFLVMTKCDKVESDKKQDYETRKRDAADALMVLGNNQRFKEGSLYCTDLTGLPPDDYRTMKNNDDINNKMLNLWMTLLDRSYRVKETTKQKGGCIVS